MLEFNCSRSFLTVFLRNLTLARKRAHLKRRPQPMQDAIDQFREKVQTLRKKYEDDHILNCDETFWRCADHTLYAWAPVGSDNVHIYTAANEKAGFTALGTISHAGSTLPLVLVGKGRTLRCERSQFGFINSLDTFYMTAYDLQMARFFPPEDEDADDDDANNYNVIEGNTKHYTTHSLSGWVDIAVWVKYLYFIRSYIPYKPNTHPYAEQNKIILICDAYPVHHSIISQQVAAILNIELVAVLNGATDDSQPLDRRIFGALKSRLRAELNKHITDSILSMTIAHQGKFIPDELLENFANYIRPCDMPQFSKAEACKLLIKFWESQVLNAWQLATYSNESGEDT